MARQPNILWLVADHAIQANRPPVSQLSPLQQFLKSKGSEFSRAYTALPVCSPARASMLTGLYPHAHGLTENDGRFGGRAGLEPEDWTLNRALSDLGYRCAWFGKWHVDNHRDASAYGFEGFSLPAYGYPYATDEYDAYLHRHSLGKPLVRTEIPGESGRPGGLEIDLQQRKDWFDYEAGSASLQNEQETHEAFFLADLASRWIAKTDGAPYFVRVDTWGPHPPYFFSRSALQTASHPSIELPESFYDDLDHRPVHHRDYRDEWRECLRLSESGWKTLFQHALAQSTLVETALLHLVKRIDLDNNLVIYTADHGDAVGTNGGTANKGGLMTEATMRIPLLIAGPGTDIGQCHSTPVSNLDLTATVLDVCGAGSFDLHSRSLLPLLRHPGTKDRCGLLTQHNGLHVHLPQRAWYEDDWKLVVQADGFLELYDLGDDPSELCNLAQHPAHGKRCSAMLERLHKRMDELGDHF